MLDSLSHLALEVKYLDRACDFYTTYLDLPVEREDERELVFRVGGTDLILRRPTSVPRGGLHTHYAFSTSPEEYDDWLARLEELDPDEHTFGSSRSLYIDDPDDHCVEIGEVDDSGTGLTGIFEVVLEVADLDRAEAFYTDLGFELTDRGSDRRRVRLVGPMDLELWEPQLGLADAHGGAHVDLGFDAADPERAVDPVRDRVCAVESLANGVRILDPDGHYLTVR
ncbi:VOC family protein [Halalkalicoccus jeotgali]|uniref:Glyoxalase/bleomycin resistance protein/dioxygenase n=1 Tax=Halalkalicoccus jeotgali (strain DSM 18796 / CECT 7217 / JCM 14584 / KCTC 4019 / B3) TaxID=795797 RepID=D8J4N0_HALJB|nr:VOC family protein [Halalkalicoccus jeotgali]ADJ15497.1 Glyoxalase/bleomycin resistance protein/dioxygenase [Halalkalicoccus jeotgali B3]ELY36094.1 Glyoxalase/bleomycin resistance protein/dioxygenase [Halalkalicoccus jeotgali B3]